MEHLRLQADRFRRQGRLQDDKMETIIEELTNDMEADRDGEQDSEATRSDKEHKRVMEVVDEGLLQVHGIAPNSKQDGIFCVMCEIQMDSTIRSVGTARLLRHWISRTTWGLTG
jgi:hypothetical protein